MLATVDISYDKSTTNYLKNPNNILTKYKKAKKRRVCCYTFTENPAAENG